jgi:hypothetical protein
MLAWGLSNGQFTERTFAQKASAEGYEWAALELDDYGNAARWDEFRFECVDHNVMPGIWTTEGGAIVNTPADAYFAIAELEGPGDYDGIMRVINDGQLPNCSLAVCANFNAPLATPGELHPDKAAPLIAAGFSCLTECYMGDNPAGTPDAMDSTARRLGWATSQPVFGLYNAPPSTYAQWQDWPGVDYLAENVL